MVLRFRHQNKGRNTGYHSYFDHVMFMWRNSKGKWMVKDMHFPDGVQFKEWLAQYRNLPELGGFKNNRELINFIKFEKMDINELIEIVNDLAP